MIGYYEQYPQRFMTNQEHEQLRRLQRMRQNDIEVSQLTSTQSHEEKYPKAYAELKKLQEEQYTDRKVTTELDRAVYECEQVYPETCKEFIAIQHKQYQLFCKKNLDYGPGNIAVGTKLSNDNEILASLTGIIVRANDKLQRLVNLILINRREPKNESIEDTFMDLAVYSNIAMVVKNGKWGK